MCSPLFLTLFCVYLSVTTLCALLNRLSSHLGRLSHQTRPLTLSLSSVIVIHLSISLTNLNLTPTPTRLLPSTSTDRIPHSLLLTQILFLLIHSLLQVIVPIYPHLIPHTIIPLNRSLLFSPLALLDLIPSYFLTALILLIPLVSVLTSLPLEARLLIPPVAGAVVPTASARSGLIVALPSALSKTLPSELSGHPLPSTTRFSHPNRIILSTSLLPQLLTQVTPLA